MAALIYPDYPPNLTSEQSDYIVSNIKDWSILSGLAVRPSSSFVSEKIDPSRSLAVTAPVTLFPSLFPRECFEEARAIQTAYNELYACIANDEEWLGEVVKEYACISTSSIPTKISVALTMLRTYMFQLAGKGVSSNQLLPCFSEIYTNLSGEYMDFTVS